MITGQRDSRIRESATYGASPRSMGSRVAMSDGRVTQFSQGSRPLSIDSGVRGTDFKPIINENSRVLSQTKRVKKDN